MKPWLAMKPWLVTHRWSVRVLIQQKLVKIRAAMMIKLVWKYPNNVLQAHVVATLSQDNGYVLETVDRALNVAVQKSHSSVDLEDWSPVLEVVFAYFH